MSSVGCVRYSVWCTARSLFTCAFWAVTKSASYHYHIVYKKYEDISRKIDCPTKDSACSGTEQTEGVLGTRLIHLSDGAFPSMLLQVQSHKGIFIGTVTRPCGILNTFQNKRSKPPSISFIKRSKCLIAAVTDSLTNLIGRLNNAYDSVGPRLKHESKKTKNRRVCNTLCSNELFHKDAMHNLRARKGFAQLILVAIYP